MDALKHDAPSGGYDVTRFTCHASRPGFRIVEMTLNSIQQVPWHYHSNVQDTFYVLEGELRIFLREPNEEVCLTVGETYSIRPRRPHLVTNRGEIEATFFVLQGVGEYDFVSLTRVS
jgi:mannose-6-phosphate isomerase-like protein (cupin superfamily)